MVPEQRPEEVVTGLVRKGISTFQTVIEGVTDLLRAGDSTIKELDAALTGQASSRPTTPEESFIEIVALMQAAIMEAREAKSATKASVIQRAREVLGRATRQEPSWRPGPAVIKTANDVFRVALRDLRASQNLLKLAQGNGSLDDLDKLSEWAEEVTDRIAKTQAVIAQPKPAAPPPEATTAPETAPPAAKPPPAPTGRKPRKKGATSPKKGRPEDIAFAQAVAEEMGDTKVKEWAEHFAEGRITEKQWISRLTTHAAATRDSLDEVFARATERMARDAAAN